MRKHVLITGGAGFIGSHLADKLLSAGHRVRALDSLVPQVHGPEQRRPSYLSRDVELVVGDVRDKDALRRSLMGIDVVVHLAALVGVGQSMYQIADYTSANSYGTSTLLEALIQERPERLIVASSMSVYGEGLYKRSSGQSAGAARRTLEQLKARRWEVEDSDGTRLIPMPTPETKAPRLESIYALSKYDQERQALIVGRAYGIPTIAFRFFNVYGPRQALSNPYTGVLAIFAARLLNNRSPLVFEDGLQQRDFVSVHDIARLCALAVESNAAVNGVFNGGSGTPQNILDVADSVARALGKPQIKPEITGQYRVGDIRHCFADLARTRDLLGYEPQVGFEAGVLELAEWLRRQVVHDRVAVARKELETRGLTL